MRYCQSRGSNFLAANLRSWRPGQSYCDFQNHPFNQPQMQINTLRETGKRWTLRLLWCNWKDLDDRSLAMSKSWWSGGYWMRYCWVRDNPFPLTCSDPPKNRTQRWTISTIEALLGKFLCPETKMWWITIRLMALKAIRAEADHSEP
jgi:hypothetical protein